MHPLIQLVITSTKLQFISARGFVAQPLVAGADYSQGRNKDTPALFHQYSCKPGCSPWKAAVSHRCEKGLTAASCAYPAVIPAATFHRGVIALPIKTCWMNEAFPWGKEGVPRKHSSPGFPHPPWLSRASCGSCSVAALHPQCSFLQAAHLQEAVLRKERNKVEEVPNRLSGAHPQPKLLSGPKLPSGIKKCSPDTRVSRRKPL